MKNFQNSTFLKCLDWVQTDEVSSRPSASSNFHEVLCKDKSTLISSAPRFELWSNQNQCLVWSFPAAPCGVVLPPPSTTWDTPTCWTFALQDVFAGNRLRPRAPSQQEEGNPGRSHERDWWCLVTNTVWVRSQAIKTWISETIVGHLLGWIYAGCRTE